MGNNFKIIIFLNVGLIHTWLIMFLLFIYHLMVNGLFTICSCLKWFFSHYLNPWPYKKCHISLFRFFAGKGEGFSLPVANKWRLREPKEYSQSHLTVPQENPLLTCWASPWLSFLTYTMLNIMWYPPWLLLGMKELVNMQQGCESKLYNLCEQFLLPQD